MHVQQAKACSGGQCTSSCNADICVNAGETVTINVECTNTNPSAIETCVMLNGPPDATFESSQGNPAEATMTWTNAGPPGTYEASFYATAVFCPPDVTCTDSPVDTVTIIVNAPGTNNNTPLANAGPDQSNIKSGVTITLHGSGTKK